MKIVFIHPHKAFLPEIPAYKNFFNALGVETAECRTGEEINSAADVHWHFMGRSAKRSDKKSIPIHEYASASVNPFRKQKDLLKRVLNPKPEFRLFLNEYVETAIGFHDEIPSGFRDMGVADVFFADGHQQKLYDFIYTGSVGNGRHLERLLECFQTGSMVNQSLLILSKDYEGFAARSVNYPNIQFKGPVPNEAVAGFIKQSRFALNIMPDEEPFNCQTSTKFLEYAAAKIPIISNNYFWIAGFEERFSGAYFYLKEDWSNFTWMKVNAFSYAFPPMEDWRWENQIRGSGVIEFLQTKFPKISF